MQSSTYSKEQKKLEKNREILKVFLNDLIPQIPSNLLHDKNQPDTSQVLQKATEALPQGSSLRKVLEKNIDWCYQYLERIWKEHEKDVDTYISNETQIIVNKDENNESNPDLATFLHKNNEIFLFSQHSATMSSILQLTKTITSNTVQHMTKLEILLIALRANSLSERTDLSNFSRLLYQTLVQEEKTMEKAELLKKQEIVLEFISSYTLLTNLHDPDQKDEIDPIYNVIAWYIFSFSSKKIKKKVLQKRVAPFLATLLASRSVSAKVAIACAAQHKIVSEKIHAKKNSALVFEFLIKVLVYTNMTRKDELPSLSLVNDVNERWRLMVVWAEKAIGREYLLSTFNKVNLENINILELEKKDDLHEREKVKVTKAKLDNVDDLENKKHSEVRLEVNCIEKSDKCIEGKNIKDEERDRQDSAKPNLNRLELTDSIESAKGEHGEDSSGTKEVKNTDSGKELLEEGNDKMNNMRHGEISENLTLREKVDANKNVVNSYDSKEELSGVELRIENNSTEEKSTDHSQSKPTPMIKLRSTPRRTRRKTLKLLESEENSKRTQNKKKDDTSRVSLCNIDSSVLPNIPEASESESLQETIVIDDLANTGRKRSVGISTFNGSSATRSRRKKPETRPVVNCNDDNDSITSNTSNSSLRRSSRKRKPVQRL